MDIFGGPTGTLRYLTAHPRPPLKKPLGCLRRFAPIFPAYRQAGNTGVRSSIRRGP